MFLLYASISKYSTVIITIVLLIYLTARYIWIRCSKVEFNILHSNINLLFVFSELIFEGPSWARIRNVQMLLTMKIISLVFDLKKNTALKRPSFIQFFGYIFCVGNCVFGPWVNYSSYLAIYRREKWVCLIEYIQHGVVEFVCPSNCSVNLILQDIGQFKRVFWSLSLSLAFFSISMCYLDWFSFQISNQ